MKTIIFLWLSSLIVFCSATTFAQTKSCVHTSKEQVASLLQHWINTLQTGDPKQVVDLYAKKSILLATIANQPLVTKEAKLNYFKNFLRMQPSAKIDFQKIFIHCNTAIDNGIYTFKFEDGSTIQARYTFHYKWDGKKWLITSHHSSQMPEKK